MNDNKFISNYIEFSSYILKISNSLVESDIIDDGDRDYLENLIFINFIDVIIDIEKEEIQDFTKNNITKCLLCKICRGDIRLLREITEEDISNAIR